MCKIMLLKGVQDSGLALDFMKAVAPTMSQGNSDGIGYSAVNSKNKMFMEKWHKNSQFLQLDTVVDKDTIKALEPFKSRIGTPSLNYSSYGDITRNDMTTITMHTRYATCGKEFANTHPFVDNEISLIHNGGISNSDVLKLNKLSTCDSETALQLYSNDQINLTTSPVQMQSFLDKLKGYWAFAFLAKDTNGNYMLDVVRERASVYWADLPELGVDCVVFATTQAIIETGCKSLGLPPRETISLLPESNYYRYNAVTGRYIFDYNLQESVLNTYVTPSYIKNYYSTRSGFDYDYDTTSYLEDYKTSTIAEKKIQRDKEIEEIYEGYSSDKKQTYVSEGFGNEVQGINDDLDIQSFFEIDEPLLDRLYSYDSLMGTSYGDTYEDLPFKVMLFIEQKEEEDYIIFTDILEMIESYQATDSVKGIFEVFTLRKRA